MATLTALIAALPQLIGLINLFVNTIKATPAEARRDSLVAFDDALKKAADKKDLTALSIWFGKRL